MKTINIDLSLSSIDKAIEQIERYKKQMQSKTKRFLERLSQIGIEVIEERMSNFIGDSDSEHTVIAKTKIDGKECTCTITLRGDDVAFIEFGAGMHYNGYGSPNPKGAKFGFTIGSYGYHQGLKDHWYYEDENGQRTISFGTKASMPMYNAEMQMLLKIREAAQEVFG